MQQLSETLRALPVHAAATKNDRFRNPDGVVFKIGNLRSVATGRGLGNVAAIDRAVWAEFGGKPESVRTLAARIRAQAEHPVVTQAEVGSNEDDEEFAEGRIFTALHKMRERSPALRRRLLAARRKLGQLRCDACASGPSVADQDLREAAFEVHHVAPLAQSDTRLTRTQDLALLCATCHRMIHRAMHLHRRLFGVPELRQLFVANVA